MVQRFLDEVTFARRRWADRKQREKFSELRLPFDWAASPFNRVAVLNRLACLAGAYSYLEIGCAGDESFDAVACIDKTGVDPERGGTHRMTSDEFFLANRKTFDLVFIDGLHEYSQALADVENALAVLNPNGIIVLHDCLPACYAEQAVPRQQGVWTGDVWKVVVSLKRRSDVDVRVIAVDHGCGIVIPRSRTDSPELPPGRVEEMTHEVFTECWPQFGIIEYSDLASWLEHAGDKPLQS